MAWPTTRSLWPYPYTGAVSTRLIPWSKAAWMAAIDCRSSAPPHIHPPVTHAPKPTAEMSIPDDPSLRINMVTS